MILTEMQILKLISWISQHEQRNEISGHNNGRIDWVVLEEELKGLDLGDE